MGQPCRVPKHSIQHKAARHRNAGSGAPDRPDGPVTAGLVLANTAVHHDFSAGLPTVLRPARALAEAVCVRTPTFVRGATTVSRPRPPREIRDAFAAPYRRAADRSFVGQFVADIPLETDHPSRATFEEVARVAREYLGCETCMGTVMERDESGRYTGAVAGETPAGEEKVRRIRTWADATFGKDGWELVHAYGDHHSDVDLLSRAKEAFAVCPGSTLRPIAKKRGWQILDWDE